MKEAIVHPDTTVTIQEVPIPIPARKQILIKVVAFGTNPKDWKIPAWQNLSMNSGDDVAGYVEAVGEDVIEFQKGDRAATMPLTFLTAAFALFYDLELPTLLDKQPNGRRTAFIIYGASTAVGAFAIKLASAAHIHPIIAIGSRNSDFVKEYLQESEGDAFLDYTTYESHGLLSSALRAILSASNVPEGRSFHALDAVSIPGTYDNVLSRAMAGPPQQVTGQRPRIAVTFPVQDRTMVDKSVDIVEPRVNRAHSDDLSYMSFGTAWCAMLEQGLRGGWIKPHPHRVILGGLEGLGGALQELKMGKVKAKKLIGRIEGTPGITNRGARRLN
ncbi:hypothetical protein A0O28_0006240 [Trichoderma guizhouense]|uniref:Alcohol dehydrogenase-like N-terminal domain-containing protein n=1 Tax=Trichoderma guizhouense TaxID=1491466 RepID=A0A1T3CHX2_9HYPO|nr:hypothetical protein A0O28_0006240 [Trichoderma guizhouense]